MTVPTISLTEPRGAAGAPVLVLGHALGAGPLIWEKALPLLESRYRVSLMTLPGHVKVPVPTDPFTMTELAQAVAEATREMTGGEKALYAGVSIGGAIALELGLHHADVFSAVASLASGAELGGREHWAARAETVREQSTAALVGPSSERWFAPESIEREPELVGRILHALRDTNDEGYIRCTEALGGYDVRAELGQIAVPVLAVWGEHDTVGTEAKQDEIVAGVQQGRKVCVEGTSHQIPAERAEETAQMLLDFFGEAL